MNKAYNNFFKQEQCHAGEQWPELLVLWAKLWATRECTKKSRNDILVVPSNEANKKFISHAPWSTIAMTVY